MPDNLTAVHKRRGEKGIWQRRFWEHVIEDEGDFALHLHLITTAPVRAGLVRRATDWPYASWPHVKGATLKTIARVPSSPDRAVAAPAM
ncbi:hypothetical protein SKA53_01136 [Yoonia vestfoldensis SKA53]|uniref:Transposase n=1 Tax=Yoonia vestfoldensis SKA53 TaxID=314232 RepID=A3V3A0_9RHOB|nr:hypothetical protein SKA53_01136 [Yoonia vestfoldensis SKA53]